MSSTAVAPYGDTFGETARIGEVLAQSGFFKDTRSAAQAVVKVLAGRELGFGPIASMTGIHIIEGKVSVGANLMAAAVDRSPRYGYRVQTLTDERCSIEFVDADGDRLGVSEFSTQDANRAGVGHRDNWRKHPRNMLFARAISNGVRWYCPGVFGGPVYVPEELGADVDADGEIVATAPDPQSSPPGAPDAALEPGSAQPPASAPATSLDEAILRGDVEGIETPQTPSAPPEPQADRSTPPTAPVASDAPAGARNGDPAGLAESLGIAPATQRLILLTEGGLEDASDLDAAYRALPDERKEAVARALAKKAKTA